MKIYTKTGDKGSTSLLGGTRVSKANERINCYGMVDELNAHVGLLRDYDLTEKQKQSLIHIQNNLFTIGSNLADESEDNKFNLPTIKEQHIVELEEAMDKMNETLPELRSFVLPGGHMAVSQSHVCRCVCRRAERSVVGLMESIEIDDLIAKYLNRLSDYFFTLSRALSQQFNAKEIPWVSK